MARTVRILLVAVLALGLLTGIGEAKSKRAAWMGVYTQSVDRDLAEALDLKTTRGAIINNVADDSPAEAAGLKKDDIIIAVDKVEIDDAADLTEQILAHKAGDEITVTVLRDDAEQDVTLTLESRRRGDVVVWSMDDDNPWKSKAYAETLDRLYTDEPYGYLGVQVDDLSAQLGEYFGVDKGRGALVSEVEKASPAEAAGLKAGDVIVAIDDEKVYDSRDVTDLIREQKKGDAVSIRVIRDKKEVTLSATLDEQEGADFGVIRLPDLPDVNLNLPQMRGLRFGDTRSLWDSDDFRKEMDELREELQALQKELQDLRLEVHEQ